MIQLFRQTLLSPPLISFHAHTSMEIRHKLQVLFYKILHRCQSVYLYNLCHILVIRKQHNFAPRRDPGFYIVFSVANHVTLT